MKKTFKNTVGSISAGLDLHVDYDQWLKSLKQRIAQTQVRAAVSVNRELVLLYWQLGRDILIRQANEGWGAKVVDRLARDLSSAFPKMKGWSRASLMNMRSFAQAWPDEQIVQQLVGQIPWGHNLVLLQKLKEQSHREWYAHACLEYGWSRDVLLHQVASGLMERQGSAITNFATTLPAKDSELAQQLIRDPQIFDFLDLGPAFQEKELEDALVLQIQKLLLELGKGFAFMGRQYHLEVGGQDYYVDLLFYNTVLHCYFVVELKVGQFIPEHLGKLSFYLAAIDEQLKQSVDGPTIGLLLCREKNNVVARYALRDHRKPMGVAEFRLKMPPKVGKSLVLVNVLEEKLSATAADALHADRSSLNSEIRSPDDKRSPPAGGKKNSVKKGANKAPPKRLR